MTPTIEICARAAWFADFGVTDSEHASKTWSAQVPQEPYNRIARAVLTALRDNISEGMIEAARDAISEWCDIDEYPPSGHTIQEALKDALNHAIGWGSEHGR